MFLALVSEPYVLDGDLAWDSQMYLIQEKDEKKALEKLKEELEKNLKKDEEVTKILVRSEGFKEGEYFQVYLFSINPEAPVVFIPEQNELPIKESKKFKI